jgi:hypothetical protein
MVSPGIDGLSSVGASAELKVSGTLNSHQDHQWWLLREGWEKQNKLYGGLIVLALLTSLSCSNEIMRETKRAMPFAREQESNIY